MALDLKNVNLKLPSNLPIDTKFLLILIVVVGGIYYAYYTYSYKPKKRKIEELNKEILDLKNELATLQVQVQNLEETKRKLDSLMIVWQKVQVLLPDKKDVPAWFDEMIAASRRAGVNVVSFKPSSPNQTDKYTRYPFELQFKATYHSLGAYLASIANHPRITRVTNLQLNSVSESDHVWTLEGSMTVSTFVFNPSFVEKRQAQQGGGQGTGQKK